MSPTLPVSQAILSWAKERPAWQQDALRRLAISDTLAPADEAALLSILYAAASLPSAQPAEPIKPLTALDLGFSPAEHPLSIVGIRNVANVNRLVKDAALTFHEVGLTVIYGANGAGKTGFIRIFRTACRTRASDAAKNQILSDITGVSTGVKTAEIVVKTAAGEKPLPWQEGAPAIEQLMCVAVFDRKAAELYVNEGNQIAFLPFSLALLFRLNDLVLRLKAAVDKDRAPTSASLSATIISFPIMRDTKAQKFYRALKATTTDTAIDEATIWTDAENKALQDTLAALGNTKDRATDLTALADWLDATKDKLNSLHAEQHDARINETRAVAAKAKNARLAADAAAQEGFLKEPLPHVGEDIWQRLWAAARNYSTVAAYPDRPFPVTTPLDGEEPRCLLCQQPLSSEAQDRLQRFEAFITDQLNRDAQAAEADLTALIDRLTQIKTETATIDQNRLRQLEIRDAELAAEIRTAHADLCAGITALIKSLSPNAEQPDIQAREIPNAKISEIAAALRAEAETHKSAADAELRAQLQDQANELADRQTLHQNLGTLRNRRDLMLTDGKFVAVLDQLQTTGITRKANELLDIYLTDAVINAFQAERSALNINHLNVSLKRKSDKSGAAFDTKIESKIKAKTSDVLSEGEQTALALAAFFTEASIAAPHAPLIIDDPVCSMDRERGGLVAKRIVEAAKSRQVIVFTHDLVFLNDLSAKAEDEAVPISTSSIFRSQNGTGVLDPAGEPWKGKKVKQRLNVLRQEFHVIRKLHQTSPSDYERKTKDIYGRLRDTWERAVEEDIFKGVIRRFSNDVRTRELRYVELSDDHADRFKEGMDKASMHSHDNPATQNVPVPVPDEVETDFTKLEQLLDELNTYQEAAAKRRKS